jgi:hypothetical protein
VASGPGEMACTRMPFGPSLAGKRLDVFFGLVVEIGDSELGTEGAERLCATPSDGLVVGDADDGPLLPSSSFAFAAGITRGSSRLAREREVLEMATQTLERRRLNH